jgi:hypothetical protein
MHRVTCCLMIVLAPCGSRVGWAQGYDPRPKPLDYGGSASYLPYGGAGFIPYSAGPGGGLGVQARRIETTTQTARGIRMPDVGLQGRGRDLIAPLAPIRPFGGTNAMGGRLKVPRRSSPTSMRPTARPPVGGYPFRQPPSLIGPSSIGSAMSM